MKRITVGLGASMLVGLTSFTAAAQEPAATTQPAAAAPADSAAPAAEPAPAADPNAGASASFGGSASTDSGVAAGGDASGAAEGPAEGATADVPAADASAEGNGEAAASGEKRRDEKWIYRHSPMNYAKRHRLVFEFGIFGGVFLNSNANQKHELFDPEIELEMREQGIEFWRPFQPVAPIIGGRFGFYPLSFLGGEIEGGAIPTRILVSGGGDCAYAPYCAPGDPATNYRFGAHLVGQLPFWSIVPFVVAGGGALGTTGALGNDIDPAIWYGIGAKFFINDMWMLRIDIRDNMAAQEGVDEGATHYPEFTLGLGIRFGSKKDEPDEDSDGDGYLDSEDDCPYDPENFNGYEDEDGCPEYDRDGDGFFDNQDACPDVPGIAPDGCPEKDRDGDGFLDSQDACPDTPGVEPDGCPIPDTDGDGILDPDDQCVTQPETKNGYQDEDGCPDEIPPKLAKFTGAIKGIYFDFNKDTIKPKSKPVLDRAVSVLDEFPSIRIEISGHTDSIGDPEYNKDLSRRRAEAVKSYLVENGIKPERVETRGAGMDEPVASNTSAAGRAKNRRIEFTILSQ